MSRGFFIIVLDLRLTKIGLGSSREFPFSVIQLFFNLFTMMALKRKQAKTSPLKSFAAAFRGVWILICNERNFRFHLLATVVVITAGFFFHVEKTEWLTIFLCIGLVLSAEAFNTSIEYICDLVSPEYHPMVKKIKDVGAAAVILSAIIAVIAGCIIFIPYLLNLF